MSTDCFFPKTIISPEGLLSISLSFYLSFSLNFSVSLAKTHSFTSQYHWDWINSHCFSQGIFCETIQGNICLRRSLKSVTLFLSFLSDNRWAQSPNVSILHWCIPHSETCLHSVLGRDPHIYFYSHLSTRLYLICRVNAVCKLEYDMGWHELWPSRFFPFHVESLGSQMGISCSSESMGVCAHTLSIFFFFSISSWGIESLNTQAKWP